MFQCEQPAVLHPSLFLTPSRMVTCRPKGPGPLPLPRGSCQPPVPPTWPQSPSRGWAPAIRRRSPRALQGFVLRISQPHSQAQPVTWREAAQTPTLQTGKLRACSGREGRSQHWPPGHWFQALHGAGGLDTGPLRGRWGGGVGLHQTPGTPRLPESKMATAASSRSWAEPPGAPPLPPLLCFLLVTLT